MKDDIFRVKNVQFYLPNYPADYVQSEIADKSGFYEQNELELFDKYLPENAVILDIGANIGNHTLYWLTTSPKRA